MDGEEVIKVLETEIARVMTIIEAGPGKDYEETFVAYNKGYLDALEYAIGEIRAFE